MRPMMPAVPAGFVDGNRVRATSFHVGFYMHTPTSLLSCLMCLSLFNNFIFPPLSFFEHTAILHAADLANRPCQQRDYARPKRKGLEPNSNADPVHKRRVHSIRV